MIRALPRSASVDEVEDLLAAMTKDRTIHIVAVEVFNHPTSKYSSVHDAVTGPYYLGPPDEIKEYMDRMRYEYEEQYELEAYAEEESK